MKNINTKVIIPPNLGKLPEENEIQIAQIIAEHYNARVEFLRPIDDYKRKTPDIMFNGQLWEMKSPRGKSRNTIGRQMKRALKQSKNIIVDGRRSLLSDAMIEKELHRQCGERHSIKRLIFVSKKQIVVEIIWK